MTPLWRVELLGGLRACRGEQALTRFRTQKTASLLAFLAFYSERAHPREVLVEMFWPDAEIKDARHNLNVALSSLRKQLEPPGIAEGTVIHADRSAIQIPSQVVTTDVAEFGKALRAAAEATGLRDRIEHLAQALDLYAGELLPGYYEEWITPQQLRLQDEYAQALVQLAALLEQSGDLPRALHYAQRAVESEGTCEEFHLTLMRLYLASGQTPAVLRQYARLERILKEHFEETPSQAARVLAEQARRQSLDTPRAEPPAPRPAPSSSPPSVPMAQPSAGAFPTGTVTFLMTDIEGSTAAWQKAGDVYHKAQEAHHALLRRQFREHNGTEIKEMGDGFLAAFQKAGEALACAIAGQKALAEQDWPPEIGEMRVRMALDSADVDVQDRDYHALALNYAARLLDAAHGGQILCSEATAGLLRRELPAEMRLIELGLYCLRDLAGPQSLWMADYPERAVRDFPSPKAAPAYPDTLPLQLTRFFGREQEIKQICVLLRPQQSLSAAEHSSLIESPDRSGPSSSSSPHRLLTLTGPGGTGKTRLSLEAARRLSTSYQGAVWFVPLADLADSRLIVTAIEEAMRLPRTGKGEPLDAVVQALSRRPSLLVLDNFEQLVEEGADIAWSLLQRVPALTLLVTSRQRLDLAGEREFVVSSLPTPQSQESLEALSQYSSVQLFVDRAQAARADFQLTRANARALAELCARLEGIPLALELAAARAKVMSPAQMLGQLANRLDFPSPYRTTSHRHRTLRAAIAWSHRLLRPELQPFFARLAVFRGGWTARAAESVCEEPFVWDYLTELRESSLILTEESGEEIRFRMLETLREYAQERLAEAGEALQIGRRHQEFFLTLAEEADLHLKGPDQGMWLQRLETEHDNLRAALAWCQQKRDFEKGLQLTQALGRFWEIRSHFAEGRRHLAEALTGAGTAKNTAGAEALRWQGVLAYRQGDYAEARHLYEQSLQLHETLGNSHSIAALFSSLGSLSFRQGQYAEAKQLHEQSLKLHQELDDRYGIAAALGNLSLIAMVQGDYAESRGLQEQSLQIEQELGNRRGIASSISNLGNIAFHQRDFPEAQRLFEQSLKIQQELGNLRSMANMYNNLGLVALEQRDYGEMQRLFEESLALQQKLGDKLGVSSALNNLGLAAMEQKDYAAARRFLEQSIQIRQELGSKGELASSFNNLGMAAQQQGRPAEAQELFEQSLQIRQELGDRPGIASSLYNLGGVLLAQGDPMQARELHEQCLKLFEALENPKGAAASWESLARIDLARGQPAQAAQFLRTAQHLREAHGIPLTFEEQAEQATLLKALQSVLGEDALAAALTADPALT